MNTMRRRFLIPVFGLIASLGIGMAPAQAAPTLGTGLVRIDADWATVKTLPGGEMVLTLDREASGQWMGEIGRSVKPVVRDLDDRDVVKVWDDLGHDSGVGVESTLTWNMVKNFQLEHLSDPVLTPRGHLRFVLEPAKDSTASELPARLENVSVNITRASSPQNRSFPVSQNFQLTSTAIVQTTNSFAYEASMMFINSALNCYSATLTQQAPSSSLPANMGCGSTLTFSSGTLTMSLPSPTGANGYVVFNTNMIASGNQFPYYGIIAQWSQAGN